MAKNLLTMESFVDRDEQECEDEEEHEGEEEEEGGGGGDVAGGQVKSNLGVTILASRFAANTRRGMANRLKLQKPEEPDFSEVS